MEIHVHDLHELALLVSVLDLGKLHDATGVTFSKSTRIHNVVSIDAEAFAREVAQVATGGEDKPDPVGAGTALDRYYAGLGNIIADADRAVADADRALSCAGEPIVDGKPHVFQDIQAAPTDTDEPAVELDSNGLPWDERIHSKPADPAKRKNADGSWRARRGVDEATMQAVTAELRAWLAGEGADGVDVEPVATETHALPTDAPDAAPASAEPAGAVDLAGLLAASQEAALNASDSLQDLLGLGRDFISAHSTAAFNALKAAVAPIDPETPAIGKAIQALTPGERRLLRACIANYPLFA